MLPNQSTLLIIHHLVQNVNEGLMDHGYIFQKNKKYASVEKYLQSNCQNLLTFRQISCIISYVHLFLKENERIMVKNMKKLLAILLAALMLVSVVACDKKDEPDQNAENSGNDTVDTTYADVNGTYTYEFIESSTIRIVSYAGTTDLHELNIPATMDDHTVIAIGDGAFANSSNIKSVKVPATVSEIGESAFAECKRLERVELPSNLVKLGKLVFSGCDNLTAVSFVGTDAEKLTVIEDYTFSGCVKLTFVNIPTTVTEIGEGVFFGCAALESITLPAGLETIGKGAFLSCASLNNVILPESLKLCMSHAFANCEKLSAISFADAANWKVVVDGFGTADELLEDIDVSTADKALDVLTDDYFQYVLKKAAN